MKTSILKLTTAVAIAGDVMPAGSLVEVSRSEASDLLRRGRAVAHKQAPGEGEAVKRSGTVDEPRHPAIETFQQDREQQAVERDHEAVADKQAPGEGEAVKPSTGRGSRKK